MNPLRHQAIIISGCIIWIASFAGDILGAQPYSTIGLIVSPVLLIAGIIVWLQYYKSTRGHYPRIKSIKDNIITIGTMTTLRNSFLIDHQPEFFTFCVLFSMGIYLLGYMLFGYSEAYTATKQYCQTNKEVLSRTGKIKYFSIMAAGTITTLSENSKAKISFTIVSDSGVYHAVSIANQYGGSKWTVDSLSLDQ